jgi:hypothetical protein
MSEADKHELIVGRETLEELDALGELGIERGDAADPVAAMAGRIGLSPRGAALEHLDRFASALCRYTQLRGGRPGGAAARRPVRAGGL